MKARRPVPKGSLFRFDSVTPLAESEEPAVRFWARREFLGERSPSGRAGCWSARIHLVSSDATRDHWAEWVLARGHGTDEAQRAKKLKGLAPIRDRVLANARIQPGDVVLE
jgi:hypothetical protein